MDEPLDAFDVGMSYFGISWILIEVLMVGGRVTISKALKFVPTPRGPELLNLEINMKDFIRKLKLRKHFFCYTFENDEYCQT